MASLSEIRTGYFARVSMNGSTGEFWFYPSNRDIPKRGIQFKVEDTYAASDTTAFTVYVQSPASAEFDPARPRLAD